MRLVVNRRLVFKINSDSYFKNSTFVGILILIIIFLTETLLFSTNSSSVFTMVSRGGTVGLAYFMFIRYLAKYRGLTKRDLMTFMVIFSILISMVLAGRFFNGYSYITQISCLMFALFFSYECSQECFAEKYIKIMRIIAIASLIGFVFGRIIASIDFIPTITNSAGAVFKTLFITDIPVNSWAQRRNWGPFREPGVFQTYLNIALYFSLFFKNKYRVFDSILFSITAITTLSGAAFIPIALIISAYVIGKDGESIKKSKIVFCIAIIIISILSSAHYEEMFFKLTGGFESSSFSYRYTSVVVNLKSFIEYPLFGAPPEIQDAARSQMLYLMTGQTKSGTTNTYLTFLSYYGAFVGGFLIYMTWRFLKVHIKSMLPTLLVFAAIIAMTSNENLTASLLICVLPFLMPEAERNKFVSNRRRCER